MKKTIKKIFYKKRQESLQEYDIDYEQLNKLLQNGSILIDVRSVQEYNEGHLKKAINIPHYEIIKSYQHFLPDKNKKIIIYCQNGGRSKKVCKKLKKQGYKNVYNLFGGLDNIG